MLVQGRAIPLHRLYPSHMTSPDSHAQNAPDMDEPGGAAPVKALRARWIFLSATALAGLFVVSAIAAWFGRNTVAEQAAFSILRDAGVDAAFFVDEIGPAGGTIRDLRLGPAGTPTLIVREVRVNWHWDRKSGQLVIDQAELFGVKGSAGIGADGKLDLGALAPLLKPSAGPQRVRVAAATVHDAVVRLQTPWGLVLAQGAVRGSPSTGWTGAARVTPPDTFVAKAPFAPMLAGFALRPAQDGDRSATEVGFSVRLDGQSLDLGPAAGTALSVLDLRGRLDGSVAFGRQTALFMRPMDLTASSVRLGSSARASDLRLTGVGDIQLTGLQAWATDLGGQARVALNARAVSGPTPASVDAVRVDAALSRGGTGDEKDSVSLQLDASGSGLRARGAGQASAFQVQAHLKGRATRLDAPDTWAFGGEVTGGAAGAGLSADRARALAAALPFRADARAGVERLLGSSDMQGRFTLTHDSARTVLAANGPLTLSSGPASARWLPQGRTGLVFAAERPEGQPLRFGVLGAGRFEATLADGTVARADVTALAASPTGWAAQGAVASFSGLAGAGHSAGGRLDRFEVSQSSQGLKASAAGVLEFAPDQPDQGALGTSRFEAQWTNGALKATIDGTVSAITGLVLPSGPANLAGRVDLVVAGDGQVAGQATASLNAPAAQARDVRMSAVRADLSARLSGRAIAPLADWTLAGEAGAFSASGTQARAVTLSGRGRLDLADRSSTFSAQAGAAEVEMARTRLRSPQLTVSGDAATSDSAVTATVRGRAQTPNLTSGTTRAQDVVLDLSGRLRGADASLEGFFDVVVSVAAATSGDAETPVRFRGAEARGPVAFTLAGKTLEARASGCLPVTLDSLTSEEFALDATTGTVCPDARGRIATSQDGRIAVHATTEFQPGPARMGVGEAARILAIGPVKGTFGQNGDGALTYSVTTSDMRFTFAAPDGGQATVWAKTTSATLEQGAEGLSVDGTLSGVSAQGLPVNIDGSVSAKLKTGKDGLSGAFDFNGLVVSDVLPAPRFGAISLDGVGRVSLGTVELTSVVREAGGQRELAVMSLNHGLATGIGIVTAKAPALAFRPDGLQPDMLVPSLRGIVAEASGVVAATATAAWVPGQPLISAAQFSTEGLSFLAFQGPVQGLSGFVAIDDLLTLRTKGPQTLRIRSFDPGIPIEEGVVTFSMPGEANLKLESASWPFAGGRLSVRPQTWAFTDKEPGFSIDLQEIDLAKFLRLTEVPNLEIDGVVSGVFPIMVRPDTVEIVHGRLSAREGGGTIRYTGPGGPPPAPPKPKNFFQRLFGNARDRVAPAPPPQGADLAIAALRALDYRIMDVTVNGRITGELEIGVTLEGSNKDVLSGFPFRFNVRAAVPVGQIRDGLNKVFDTTTTIEQARELERAAAEAASAQPAPTPASPPEP